MFIGGKLFSNFSSPNFGVTLGKKKKRKCKNINKFWRKNVERR
jgi:hypothetical protein